MRFVIIVLLTASACFGQFSNATRIQGRRVSPTAPADTDTLCWDSALTIWKPCAGGGGGSTTTVAAGAPSGACTAGNFYINSTPTPRDLYVCTVSGTWKFVLSIDPAAPGMITLNENGTPTTPAAGQMGVYFDTADHHWKSISPSAVIVDLQNFQPVLGFTPEDAADKGIAGGYASLDGSGTVPISQLPASATSTYSLGTTFDGVGVALTAGSTRAFAWCTVAPRAGTFTAWGFHVDAGTAGVKVWKNTNATTSPTVSNSINTSGLLISSGTKVRSTTLSDFTATTFLAGDNLCFNLSAVAGGATKVEFFAEYQ